MFISCKVVCHHSRIGKAICLRILQDTLDWAKLNHRSVPHSLSKGEQTQHVPDSKLLLVAFKVAKQTNFERMMRGEES
jgi:hypothetical protein